MKIKRREFLQKSMVGVGGLLVGARLAPAAESTATRCDPFQTVPLGKTGIRMSRTCMGTGMRGGMRHSNQTRLGPEAFEALLRGAYERGVRTFDLADLYGSHPYLIPALRSMPRQDFTIITKIWWRPGGIPDQDRPDADVVVARFLKEIKTDYLDLVLLHCVETGDWPKTLSRQMEILDNLKHKGVIRAHGVSCHSIPALQAAANEPWVDSVHARINPYGDSMDRPLDRNHDSVEEVVPVLRKIRAAGKGVVGMKIIGEGRYRNNDEKKDHSIHFALNSGCVDILNVGFEKTEEIDDFSARVRKVPLPA
ncbi:MAG: aldo/keto reductase [Verrucomicrobia bacterium]|nr:aldo/keto reductase [Verrucomicrobiota bacterium]